MSWITDARLRALAGERSYQRGTRYLDAVIAVNEVAGGVVAEVQGAGVYRVRLSHERGRLAGECSCPYGQEGAFCKHCVAVGLTVLSQRRRPQTDLREILGALSKDELIELLCEHARHDPMLFRRLAAMGPAETSELGQLPARAADGGYAADPLVRALLGEDDVDAAWAAAEELGCSQPVRLQVARRRAEKHPEDAIPAFIAAVDVVLATGTSERIYAEAVELIAVIKDLYERTGRPFGDYIGPLMEIHHRKTRFLADLRAARLGASAPTPEEA